MALLFVDGFDHYATSDLAKKYDAVDLDSSVVVQSTIKRTGTGALRLLSDAYTTRSVQKGFTAGGDGTVIIGFAMYLTSLPVSASGFVQFFNTTGVQCRFGVGVDGSVFIALGLSGAIIEASGGGVISSQTWHYVEIKVLCDNSGDYEVYVDGAQQIIGSADTQYQTTAGCTAIRIARVGAGGAGIYLYIDDLYICDETGGTCNAFLGDSQVDTVYPNSAGYHTDWSPSAGDNYECVNEPGAISTDDYVETSGVGNIDTYPCSELEELNVETIHAVVVTETSQKTESGDIGIEGVVRYGSSDSTEERAAITESWMTNQHIWEVYPGGGAWARSQVNACQFGIKLVA